MKRFSWILAVMFFVFVLAACGGNGAESSGESNASSNEEGQNEEVADEGSGEEKFVGVAMPTKSSERWVKDGDNMKKEFEELGYKVDLQYAEDVVENQVSQIENMITKGVDILVIASIDGEALTEVLEKAKNEGISVIAYDRLIMNSEHVSYYATFDNFQVGVLQAQYIEEKLRLKDTDESYN